MNENRTVTSDRTAVDISLFILRAVVGIIFMAHGAQKMFGAFGGEGLEATVTKFGSPLGYLVAVGEFFGGVGMFFGFLSRFSAAANIVIMIGAIVTVHGGNGFFLANRGFEYNLALIGLLLPILLCGPGSYSLGPFFLPKSSGTGRPVVILE